MATKARAQHHQKQQQQQHSHKSQDFKKAKSLKRKREQDELQKLRDGVDEFVRNKSVTTTLKYATFQTVANIYISCNICCRT